MLSYQRQFYDQSMKEKTDKRRPQAIRHLYFMLIASLFISACTGQDKAHISQTQRPESAPTPADSPATEARAAKPFIDDLFQIEGQLCAWVRRIHQDQRGNLWFGTNHYGVMRYDGDTLLYFTKKEGLGGGRITGIVEDQVGNVWFGSYGGLSKYDPSASLRAGSDSFTHFSEKEGLINHEVWSLMMDKKGTLWVGTMEGVSRFDPSAAREPGEKLFSDFSIPKAQVKDTTTILAYDRVCSILEDRNGVIWFGLDGFGITRYDPAASLQKGGKAFTHFTMENGLPDNNIYDLMEDSKGNVWIGTMFGGISRYDGKSFTNYTQDSLIGGVEVGGLYEDQKGNIWFAAENHGVYRYDGKSFTNYYTQEGLITNGILAILEDREGRFWFGGWLGLFRFDGKTFSPVTMDGPWE